VLVALAALDPSAARAGFVVLPNANTNASGNGQQFFVFDSGSGAGVTFQ
jgi:hypothetical protein